MVGADGGAFRTPGVAQLARQRTDERIGAKRSFRPVPMKVDRFDIGTNPKCRRRIVEAIAAILCQIGLKARQGRQTAGKSKGALGICLQMKAGLMATILCATAAGAQTSGANQRLSPVPSPPAPKPYADGEAVPITLAECVLLGLRENRTIRSAYIERVAEKFDLVTAEKRFSPRLDINASLLNTWRKGADGLDFDISPVASILIPTGAFAQFSWSRTELRTGGIRVGADTASLRVAQPLLRGFGTAVNMAPVRLARLQEEINRLGLEGTVADSVTAIILAYRTLIQAQEQIRIAQSGLERSRALLATNRAMIDAGRMAAADIIQTEANVAVQELAVIEANRQRDSARLELARLIGLDLRLNLHAVDALVAQPVEVDLGTAIQLAQDNRVDYLAQRRSVEQAKIGLMVAKNDRLWDVSVIGSVDRQRIIGTSVSPIPTGTSAGAGLQLRIPIGDPSLKQGEVRAATNLRQAELQLEELGARVEAQVRDAIADLETSWRRVEAARRARELAALALSLEGEKLRAGRTSNFEVLTFEGNLRAAEAQELAANIAYLNSLTSLDQQLGTTLDTWRISLND